MSEINLSIRMRQKVGMVTRRNSNYEWVGGTHKTPPTVQQNIFLIITLRVSEP